MTQIRLVAVMLLVGAVAAEAGDIEPAKVRFDDYGAIEASLTGVPGNVANAPDIMNKGAGNCVACHHIGALDYVPFHGEVGPSLDGTADRWTEAELRGIVANAKITFEGTVMPAFYKNDGFIRPGDGYTGKAPTEPLQTLLTAQQIEDVVAFLMTLRE